MAWFYLGLVLFVVIAMFIFLKRPMYEAMFCSFLVLLIATGRLKYFGHYMVETSQSYLLFTMMAFMVFGVIVERSGIIADLLNIIVALVGRFTGGAGYVALFAGAAMGAFCGTGSGTVAATGTFTIPAMKRTGFSSELSASIAAAAGTLGPIIPPSGAIPIMFEMLDAVIPGYCTAAQFWNFAWAVSFWLIVQRVITLWILIRHNKVTPMPKEELPELKDALKKGWKTLILPVTMFLPFIFANSFSDTLVTERLGKASAESFSQFILVTIPCVSCFITLLLWRDKGNKLKLSSIMQMIGGGIQTVAPIILMTFSGYAMGSLLNDLNFSDELIAQFEAIHVSKWAVILIAPLIFTFFGMFMESSSCYFLFGPVFIPIAIAVGIHPMIAAMMVNVMCNAQGQMSPPFALCLLVSIGIAEADFKKTSILAFFWCFTQYIVIVMMLAGWLPMFGLLV
jgi:C4-dicarboxylate transporter DctM subunit